MEFLRIPYFDSQKNKYCVSIPDFYIPSTNEIFEIKSDATYNQINMIDRFRKYKQMGYKNYSLILEHKNYGKRLPRTKKQNSIFY